VCMRWFFRKVTHTITEIKKFHDVHLQAGEPYKLVAWFGPRTRQPQNQGGKGTSPVQDYKDPRASEGSQCKSQSSKDKEPGVWCPRAAAEENTWHSGRKSQKDQWPFFKSLFSLDPWMIRWCHTPFFSGNTLTDTPSYSGILQSIQHPKWPTI
jgi:hypothetical protein